MSNRTGRQFAQIQMSIWEDDDFAALDAEAQRLYFALLTHRSLTLAGVADWRPKRLAARYAGGTEATVRKAAEDLRAARYLYFDDDTEEVLLRTFVRHDKVMSKPKVVVGMVRDYSAIASVSLRRIFKWELHRLRESEPDHAHWNDASSLLSDAPVDPSVDPSVDRSVYPTALGMGDGMSYQGAPYNRQHTAEGRQQTATSRPQTTDSFVSADAPTKELRDDVEKLCTHLANSIEANGLKRPTVTAKWRDTCRLMLDRDKRHPGEVWDVIAWCQADEFWRTNVLGMPKLREKYDQLLAKARAAGAIGGGPAPAGPAALSPEEVALRLEEDLEEPPDTDDMEVLRAWRDERNRRIKARRAAVTQ